KGSSFAHALARGRIFRSSTSSTSFASFTSFHMGFNPMIIENLEQVTQAVLDEMKRTPDPRTKEILASLVRHLHGFVREVKLTEKEFDKAINYVAALGRLTTESHNEVRLMAGTLG